MHKFFYLSAVCLIINLNAFSQPLSYGEQSISLALGVPTITNYDFTTRTPALTAVYEYGFSDKIGIGYIGGGALLSFAGSEYEYNYNNTAQTSDYNYITIGPRAAYHFDMVDLTDNNLWSNIDVYAGMFLGLRLETYKYTNHITDTKVKDNNTNLTTDIFAGIRYGFNDRIGALAELGFGVTYINIGVNVRL